MDDFSRILKFIKVVEAGSFSAAARHESSISSVARQVKSLEDELGVRLLNRTTRSLSLTEPGRYFYERASAIAKDLGNAKLVARSFQENVKGVLRVALRSSTASTVIVPALPALLQKYPDLRIDVSMRDDRCDLVANNIDVAIWVGNIPDADLIAKKLTPTQRLVCASPVYLETFGVPKTPSDLKTHSCILYSVPTHGNVWTFRKGASEEKVEVAGSVSADDGVVLLAAAEANLGLIVAHESTVRMRLAQKRLVRVLDNYHVNPTQDATDDAELYAVYPSSRGMSLTVRVFVDFLTELFGGPIAPPAGSSAATGAAG